MTEFTDFIEKSTLYKDNYAVGSHHIISPNYKHCCERVYESGPWLRSHQCSRPRGYGPDMAYCKQHGPDYVKAREDASRQRYIENWNRERYKFNGKNFYDALERIASGVVNDPKAFAQQIIDDFKSGKMK